MKLTEGVHRPDPGHGSPARVPDSLSPIPRPGAGKKGSGRRRRARFSPNGGESGPFVPLGERKPGRPKAATETPGACAAPWGAVPGGSRGKTPRGGGAGGDCGAPALHAGAVHPVGGNRGDGKDDEGKRGGKPPLDSQLMATLFLPPFQKKKSF